MKEQRYLAHISPDGREQTVEEHLTNTAELCAGFAAAFNCGEQGRIIGAYHDIGKRSDEFQLRLRGGNIVDHASAGALECAKAGMEWASGCIIGHHGGLPDFGNAHIDDENSPTMCGRLHRALHGGIPKYSLPEKLSVIPSPNGYGKNKVNDSFLIRMLYSCLVDADYLDTEMFMSDGKVIRTSACYAGDLLERFNGYIAPWLKPAKGINQLRSGALKACIEAGVGQRGIYTLTVPTGGGKTIASLAFALNHAAANGLDRIIYVIPYTSIIEQTADVFRSILGDESVLEHHSGASFEVPEGSSEYMQRNALATENWDAPVIVTTAVRFFESMYSNRSSACRKLHNICNSVIVFDEAQMLPSTHLRPCTAAIAMLAARFNSTVLLCTATQPVLMPLIHEYAPSISSKELCPDTGALYSALKRTVIKYSGLIPSRELADRLASLDQVLCIVNSRKAAHELFDMLSEEGCYHLSTLMYPAHRRKVLSEIRDRLKGGLPCRVISTSLIEAGVDVDFPAVYREMSGLDSILQAAGRCNREGKRPADESIVTVFESEYPTPMLQRINIAAAKEVFSSSEDPASPEAIEKYFKTLLDLSDRQHDKYNVIGSFENGISGCDLPFKTVAERFKFIDSATKTVYIPIGEGRELVSALKRGAFSKTLFRRLGQYGVGVYERHFNELLAAGAISLIDENSAVLENTGLYSPGTGIALEVDNSRCLFD